MQLPKLKYELSKAQRSMVQFQGLNLTDSAAEGEYKNTLMMSTSGYPTITQQKSNTLITADDEEVTDIYEWDNKLIEIKGGQLYYDGEPLCSCLPGKKQWAVVNTKLCVFPDQFMVDLVNHKVEFMETKISNGGTATWTNKTLSISSGPIIYAKTTTKFQITDGSTFIWQLTADNVSWTKSGGWNITNLDATSLGNNQGTHIVFPESVTYNTQSGTYTIALPELKRSASKPSTSTFATDLSKNEGFYGIAKFIREASSTMAEYEINWYWLQQENPALSQVFTVGEQISITDTYAGLLDVPYADIQAINDSTNTITFVGDAPLTVAGTGKKPAFIGSLASRYEPNFNFYYFVIKNGSSYSYYRFYKKSRLEDGTYFFITSARPTEGYIWYPSTRSYETVEVGSTTESAYDKYGWFGVKPYDYSMVSLSRAFPKLDYICEHDNRLWGVSNTDKTIYASSLGNPRDMYGSPGMEDGSYAVAVGSEGEFTGISSYGNGVCCWKENILHKMLGDSPSTYYMNTYRVAGVQKGCDKSLVVNNEVLYYKGVYGVYAYTGGTPSLISYKLGDMPMTDAVGGTDSLMYYLGLKDSEGNNILYAYDIIRNLWIKTDEIPIEAFTTIGHTVYALSDSKVYRLNDGDEPVNWHVEFAPFIEQEFSKSGYTKLLLRLDMAKGSWLKVFTKQDNSIYRPVYHKAANSQDVTVSIPLKIGRCDRFQLKLEGYGKVKIYSIAREFSKGSEV